MGTRNNPGPYDALAHAEGDEPYFVLLGRDRSAATLVRKWVTDNPTKPGEVLAEALGIADHMDRFAMEYHARPRPPTVLPDGE